MRKQTRMWLLLGTLSVCGWLAVLSLRRFEFRQVYQPAFDLDGNPERLGRKFEEAFIPVQNGQSINAWYFPVQDGAAVLRHPVFLVSHGNAGNIGDRLDLTQSLLEAGGSVLLFDYRGYGRSLGTPGEEGTYRDSQAAYRWLRAKGFATTNVISYGESLGGGVATELALRESVGGLVLQSAFTSIPD